MARKLKTAGEIIDALSRMPRDTRVHVQYYDHYADIVDDIVLHEGLGNSTNVYLKLSDVADPKPKKLKRYPPPPHHQCIGAGCVKCLEWRLFQENKAKTPNRG